MSKTYGEKPIIFSFEEGGEQYMIGSEVGNYLRLFRGALYKKYPSITRRNLTNDERRKLVEMGHSQHVTSSTISLLLAREVEDILQGRDELFKGKESSTDAAAAAAAQAARPKPVKPASIVPAMPNSSHLDAVPQVVGSRICGYFLVCYFSRQHQSTATALSTRRFAPSRSASTTPSRPWCTRMQLWRRCSSPSGSTWTSKVGWAGEDSQSFYITVFTGQKLRDTFLWNKHEQMLTAEQFAEVLCDDLDLNPLNFVPAIAAAIQQQVESFPSESDNLLREQKDQRVVIKLNIHVGNISLVDQFEWDLAENNSPEEFSRKICADLGLGGEFATAVLYSIRGQLAWHTKSYVFSDSQMPPIENAFRNQSEADIWSPFLETLTDAEMEKKIRDQDRNTRRMRRLAANTPGW